MSLIYLFRRLVFWQVLLGIVAFCIAERNPPLLLVAGPLAVLSWYVVEGPTGKPLPRLLINLGSVAAVTWLMLDLFRNHGNIVLAMGHFTMWLQVVLLYAHKTNRDYAQLLVLSLLQMIGASILSASFIFGALLVGYCLLALFSVLLLHFKVTSDTVTEANQAAAPRGVRVARPKVVVCRGHRWQFRLTALVVAISCAAVGSLLFLLIPRSDQGGGNPLMSRSEASFSPQINLDGSPLLGSHEPVAMVHLWRQGVELRGDEEGGVLLRGAALNYYDQTHTWTRGPTITSHDFQLQSPPDIDPDRQTPLRPGVALAQIPSDTPTLEADITLRANTQQILFTLHPACYLSSATLDAVTFNSEDQQLTVSDSRAVAPERGSIRYRVRAPLQPPPGMFATYESTLAAGPFHNPDAWADSGFTPARYRDLDSRPVVPGEHVRELTLNVLRGAGIQIQGSAAPEDAQLIAQALVHYLRANFTYDLHNPTIAGREDPIVQFLFKNKKGHCELFAAGLTAMARSVGLRSRVITGYLVSEYNSMGRFFVVRPANAHAWVEIFCNDEGWVAFDGTPPAALASEHAPDRGLVASIRHIYEFFEYLWVTAVVSYDRPTQAQMAQDSRRWADTQTKSLQEWATWLWQKAREQWERWHFDYLTIGVLVLIALSLLLGAFLLLRSAAIRRQRLIALQLTRLPRAQRRLLVSQLRFYLVMLDMLDRYGFVRPSWQSPFGFAQQLAQAQPQRFEPVVALTEQFYEVRFGHRQLDARRRSYIREMLTKLEDNLLHSNAQA